MTADPSRDPLGLSTSSALGLWRGIPLADAPDTDVTSALRTRLEELRQIAIEDLVDAELELGHHRRLVAELESLVTAEPLRERRSGQLMRALYGAGQQVAFTSEDRVRAVLHNFNDDGFDSLYPKYAGGGPPTFTLPQRQAIKKIALARPQDHDLPFSTWSLRGWSTTSAMRACGSCSERRACPFK